MVEHTDEDLKGSRFWRVDLAGSRFHGVMLTGVRITDAWIDDVDLSGYIGNIKVNGVEVGEYVRAELQRRHPVLGEIAAAAAVDALRAVWDTTRAQAAATVARARALPPELLDESVDEEFSFIETLRHLVFATDRWITAPVLAMPSPFHPLGITPDDPASGRALGLDVDARPSLDEVLAVRDERMAFVSDVLQSATDESLARTVENPNGGTTTVTACVKVVLGEEFWHDQYANRDLAVLEARSSETSSD